MKNAGAKPILFLAFANDRQPGGAYLRNLAEEARHVNTALQSAERSNLCQVEMLQNVVFRQVLEFFQDARHRNRIAIFHYAGHANGYQLLFESQTGETAPVDAAGFADLLGQQEGLALVFLNGCSTQQQTQYLLDAGVAAVISTSQAIDDRIATEFAASFYHGLASGTTIRTAFNEATAAVKSELGNDTRHFYVVVDKDAPPVGNDRWPWTLYLREGADLAASWSLPNAANNPFFGLPDLPALDLPAKPFRDLCWFRRVDAPIFFGRGQQIRQLYTTVIDAKAAPIVLFYGQSGVGKSSLLDAGLLPRLEQKHRVIYLRREQEKGLLGTLLSHFPAVSSGVVGDGASLREAWRMIEQQANQPLTLILDQAEEHFTRPNPTLLDEMGQFLAALVALFADRSQRPQGKLILGFRKEWLAEIEKRLLEQTLPYSKLFLERLDEDGVSEAVRGIADTPSLQQHYGLMIEEGLAEEIANDLLKDRDAPVAPMLQILLTRLWEGATQQDRAKPCFDRDLYDQLRRQGLKLNEFLSQQLAQFKEQQPAVVDSGLAIDLLSFHTTSLGTAEQRDFAELQSEYRHHSLLLPSLVQSLQALYLLVDPAADQNDTQQKSRLAHDTLAPLVRAMFDESDRPGQRARRILETRAVDWQDEKIGTPLDQADLLLVESGQSGMRIWTASEERLLAASRAEQQRQDAERAAIARKEEEARQHQLEMAQQMAQSESARAQAQSLAVRRLRWMLMAALVLVLLMLVAIWNLSQNWLSIRWARGELVTIPAGKAVIGANGAEVEPEERPQWQVAMLELKIEKFEVSNYQYHLCIQYGPCSDTTNPVELYDDTRAEYPVGYLTALQAATYCHWIGRRLPTEIEWEYAARGTTGRTWPWGNDPPSQTSGCPGPTQSCQVNSYTTGATPEGIYHLWGNVWEWTSSHFQKNYEEYDILLSWDGNSATLGEKPVLILRGGSYRAHSPGITYRLNAVPYQASSDYGVRCVEE